MTTSASRPATPERRQASTPDNLALDSRGNLVVAEDPPVNPVGADYWIAAPPRGGQHQPARTVQRFASLKDCTAEPSGPYFALAGTERFARRNPDPRVTAVVDDETLFAHRQHSAQRDQLVAISPIDDDDD